MKTFNSVLRCNMSKFAFCNMSKFAQCRKKVCFMRSYSMKNLHARLTKRWTLAPKSPEVCEVVTTRQNFDRSLKVILFFDDPSFKVDDNIVHLKRVPSVRRLPFISRVFEGIMTTANYMAIHLFRHYHLLERSRKLKFSRVFFSQALFLCFSFFPRKLF